MARTRIAIACQGGGSQTAFTAGALKALCEERIDNDVEVVSISGTSGGAVCAALIWYAYRKGERPVWGRLMEFWRDNTAQNWAEEAFNSAVIDTVRLINSGMMPAFQISPSAPMNQMMMRFATMGHRSDFTDFAGLLRKYLDFDEIASWGPCRERPALVIGAANVTTGKLAKFVSIQQPIRLEHILASCAVPSIFPAVEIDGDAYWDGLFSDNPPIEELIRSRSVGAENIPEEIWLIKINPTARAQVPTRAAEIADRRNQMEGNISLFHQLNHIEVLNDLKLADAIRPEYLDNYALTGPIRIPRSFETDAVKPYHIPCIEMAPELQDLLTYEGKIDRGRRNIEMLMEEGEKAARLFLEQRRALVG